MIITINSLRVYINTNEFIKRSRNTICSLDKILHKYGKLLDTKKLKRFFHQPSHTYLFY